MKEKMNITGMQFGDWTVLYEEPKEGYDRIWRCRCVCGTEKSVFQGNLLQGKSKGCGCSARDRLSDINRTHGKRHTRLYNIWCNMRRRCYSSNQSHYKYYGGRGIKVCDEWLGKDGFQNFWNWSYSNGYDENALFGECTLDRIDVNGDYCPDNCRWVGLDAQANNKQNTHWVNFDGEVLSLTEFCNKHGISEHLARERFNRGWTPAEVMFFRPKNVNGAIEYNGEVKTARAWAKQYGIPKSTFQHRITHGWSFEQAVGIAPPPNKHSPSWKEWK